MPVSPIAAVVFVIPGDGAFWIRSSEGDATIVSEFVRHILCSCRVRIPVGRHGINLPLASKARVVSEKPADVMICPSPAGSRKAPAGAHETAAQNMRWPGSIHKEDTKHTRERNPNAKLKTDAVYHKSVTTLNELSLLPISKPIYLKGHSAFNETRGLGLTARKR
jgi:hypothetical protein